jgi:large subunit ribosomal protein L25
LDEIRKGENIPAVFYGNGVESTSITLSESEFKSVWKKAGSSALITLTGVDGDKEVIIQDMDIDPVSSQVRHIDFYVVKRGQVMEVDVPLEFVGVSPAVKELGGILVKVMHELKVEVLPKDIPQHIEIDISSLKELDSQITIKDLKLPEGVKALDEETEVVVAISEAQEESEEAIPTDISQIEIEKKGKKEEETTQ